MDSVFYIKLFFLCMMGIVVPISSDAQRLAWVQSWGSLTGYASDGLAVTLDKESNAYTTGSFVDVTDFDPGPGVFPLTASGTDDIFVAKSDAAGNFLWARRMGGFSLTGSSDIGYAIITDTSGNVYLTGTFQNVADFGSTLLTASGERDAFICKLDKDGNFLWAKSVGSKLTTVALAISLDQKANVYVTGAFQDTVDFDPGLPTFYLSQKGYLNTAQIYAPASCDMFILKLDTDGNFSWVRQIAGAFGTAPESINIDSSGYIYTSGGFGGGENSNRTTDFDPGAGTYNLTANRMDMFILKLDSTGNFVWAKSLRGKFPETNTSCYSVLDVKGYIYLSGNFRDTVDFDPGPGVFNLTTPKRWPGIPSAWQNEPGGAFAAKYDPSGNLIWAKNIGYSHCPFIVNMATRATDIYLTGSFDGTVDFDPGAGTFTMSANPTDIFILKLDTTGNFSWALSAKGTGIADRGHALVADACNNIYLTGCFSRTRDFDPGPDVFTLTAAGGRDVFLLKIAQQIPPVILVDTFILSVPATYASYQWYLNGQPIPGATDSFYNVRDNGDYTVVVTNTMNCADTTKPYRVSNVYEPAPEEPTGINSSIGASAIRVYPNPAMDRVRIEAPFQVLAQLSSVEGKLILQQQNAGAIDISALSPGLYLLTLRDRFQRLIKTEKLIKK